MKKFGFMWMIPDEKVSFVWRGGGGWSVVRSAKRDACACGITDKQSKREKMIAAITVGIT